MSDTSYLPAECQAAIDETNQKYNEMKEVWDNYISNLRNGKNNILHKFSHVQEVNNKHLDLHSSLRLNIKQ